MKKIVFSCCMVTSCFISIGYAQNAIPNPGFETWTTQGSYSDPNSWGTINQPVSQACLCPGNATKATAAGDVHSGTFALKLKTLNVVVAEAPGIVATGTINTTTKTITGGVAFNLRPTAITGWYKYAPVGTDTGSVIVGLSVWNTSTKKRDTVGYAKFNEVGSVPNYTQFTSNIHYFSSVNPDTMVIVLLSSWQGATNANTNSTLFIDDLAFTFPTGVNENNSASSISVYPNPASDEISFSTSVPKFTLKIFDMEGKQIIKEESNTSVYKWKASPFSEGIYFYELTPANNIAETMRGKFAISK